MDKNNTAMASRKSSKQIRLQNTTVVETYLGAKVINKTQSKYSVVTSLFFNLFICLGIFLFHELVLAAVPEAYLVLSDHVQTRIDLLV